MEVIEQKYIRITLWFVIAIGTPFVLFMAIHGLILGYGGIEDYNLLLLGMGFATVAGLLGFIGAGYRLLKTLTAMSQKQKHITRALLISGIASGLYLVGGCLYSGMPISITLVCLLITIGGGIFLYATPKNI